MTLPNLESLRVFSQLTGRIHYIEINGKKYACVGGIAMPYNLAIAFIIWSMTTERKYQKLLYQDDQLRILADLNPLDTNLTAKSEIVWYYVHRKLTEIMQNWTAAEFEELVPEFVEEVTE
jgi:hypothetical protein